MEATGRTSSLSSDFSSIISSTMSARFSLAATRSTIETTVLIWRTDALKPSLSERSSNWLTRLFIDMHSSCEGGAARPQLVGRPPGRDLVLFGRPPRPLAADGDASRPRYRVGHGLEL